MKSSLIFSICLASALALSGDLFAQSGPPNGDPGAGRLGDPGTGRPGDPGAGRTGAGNPGGNFGGAPAGTARPSAPVGPAGRAPVVVTVDVVRLLEGYDKSKHWREMIRNDSQAANDQLKKEGAKLNAIKEKLQNLKPGSSDFKRLEEEYAQVQSDLQIRAKIQERDFKERAMKQDFQLLTEINDEVKRYADANGISLVLHRVTDQVDPTSMESVGRAVEQMQVIFYQNGPDITQKILETLNARYAARPRGPASQAPRRQ